jgi:hypothetical protein
VQVAPGEQEEYSLTKSVWLGAQIPGQYTVSKANLCIMTRQNLLLMLCLVPMLVGVARYPELNVAS